MIAGKVDWVAPKVRRILAPNPSAMTGPGTNSYLIGQGGALALLDPGPDMPEHIKALTAALAPGERITDIIVTHAHLDHSAAAPRIAALVNAPVHGFGAATSGRSAVMQRLAASGLTGGGEGIDHSFRPDRLLADGASLVVGDCRLEVIHTPGHMGGHVSLAFGNVLFSGDHAMGWASSLVSPPEGDMGAYMESLRRLMVRDWQLMLPGHGAAVPDVALRLAELYQHRQQREAEILAVLHRFSADSDAITRQVYRETPAALLPAARRNVLAHLIDLAERSMVFHQGDLHADTVFSSKSF